MSLQIERQLQIQELINKQQTVKVEELARKLNVSPNTIRRDLRRLERQGVLKRIQGGAMLPEIQATLRQSFDLRSRTNPTEKEIIGKYATNLVRPGSTIIIDAGTTTQQLANCLCNFENVTVASNSLEVGYTLMSCPHITVILSGGIVLGNSRVLTGLPAENFFLKFMLTNFFWEPVVFLLKMGLPTAICMRFR